MDNNDRLNNSDHVKKMADMPVGKLIFTMSWPAIISMFIQAFYNVVDSFFVSLISEQALAAVTYIFPIQMLIISVAVGTGVGINSLISRRLGAKRYEEADMAASHGYRLSFFSWAFFALIGIFLSVPMMELMSDTPYIVENGIDYMRIITIGSLFSIVQITTEKILQSTGSMKIPMICSMVGAVTNIIMDPVLIFGIGPFPEMGVTGAAVATVLGQFLSMCLGQIFLFGREHAVHVKLFGWKTQSRILKDIYAVGAPAMLMQSIASIMQFGMNIILGSINETAVAVMGVYGRLQSFIFMPVFGLNQGVLPIMGFNYGARSRKRLMEAYKKGLLTAAVIMAIGLVIFQVFPRADHNIQFHGESGDVRYRDPGFEDYKPVLPAGRLRHHVIVHIPGYRPWFHEPVGISPETAGRDTATGVDTRIHLRTRTGMVFIPSGRADRYSVFHHSAEIRVQEGDKASRYNKRGHALRVSGIKVDDIFSIVFSES